VDTIGSDFDTILGIYIGTDLINLVEVASDDNSAPDGIRSKVTFSATNGTTYLVLVDGVNGAQGTITLNWSLGTAPQITQPPVGASVPVGGSVTLSAAASGNPGPAYQWRLNGAAIPGAIGASLTVNDFQFDDEGSYSVAAINSVGQAVSASAFLALDIPAQLGPVSKSGGGSFQMQLTGTARQNYVIQATTNLLFTNTAWTSLIVTSSFTGVFDYIDNGATNNPRFYRAVKQ